jgi:predicted HicB family RNase H-like nuclease
MSPSREPEVRVTLRMPESVHERAKAAAERETRSLNNMLVVLIGRGLSVTEGEDQGG